jgi:23S rRNA pseudouridine2604 synthase
MCEYVGFSVTRLQRVRIMNIMLDTPVGVWRDLTAQELHHLGQLTEESKGVPEDVDEE